MNTEAFTHIFRENFPLLFAFTRRIVDDAGVAEEIAGDVFMKLWERFQGFDNPAAIKSFLYISARNSSLNYLEDLKRKKKRERELVHLTAATEQAALHHIIHLEALSEIYKAIEELPGQTRKVIQLTFEEGLKAQEIADRLGTSVNTVRNQKAKGLLLLRKLLSGRAFEMFMILLRSGTF